MPEVAADGEDDLVAGGGPVGGERAGALAVEERPLVGPVHGHDLEARVARVRRLEPGGVREPIAVLAEDHALTVRRERHERLVQEELELGVGAEGGLHVLGVAEALDALVDHLAAVGRPARAAHRPRDDGLDPPVGMPDPEAALVSPGAAHVANAPSRQPRRRELRLPRGGDLYALAGGDVHPGELGARPAALRQVRAHGVGLVEQQAPAVRRPRRAARHAAGGGQAAQPGAVGPHHVDPGRLQVLPHAGLVPGLGVPVRGEGDPRPVGRPAGPKVARRVVGQVRGGLRGEVEQPDVGGAPRPRGDERERPAVRRQGPLIVERRVIR